MAARCRQGKPAAMSLEGYVERTVRAVLPLRTGTAHRSPSRCRQKKWRPGDGQVSARGLVTGSMLEELLKEDPLTDVEHRPPVQRLLQAPGLELGRHYAHAPIVEAILQFRVENSAVLSLESLAQLPLAGEYGDPAPVFDVNTEYSVVDGELTTQSEDRQIGWAYQRQDRAHVVQASLNLFSFHWREPYTRWDDFKREAELQWNT